MDIEVKHLPRISAGIFSAVHKETDGSSISSTNISVPDSCPCVIQEGIRSLRFEESLKACHSK